MMMETVWTHNFPHFYAQRSSSDSLVVLLSDYSRSTVITIGTALGYCMCAQKRSA